MLLSLCCQFPCSQVVRSVERPHQRGRFDYLRCRPCLLGGLAYSFFLSNFMDWRGEMVLYSLLVFLSAASSAWLIKATKQPAAFSAGLFATLPIHLFNIANIGFTLLSIASLPFGGIWGQIGWSAFFSASTITVMTLAASTAGGGVGCLAARSRK